AALQRRGRRSDDVVVDGGCDVRVGGVVLGARARVALLAWLPLAPFELAPFEGGLFSNDPAQALALLLRPPTIWSLEEARLAALDHAAVLVTPVRMQRTREAAKRVSGQLPVERFPVASATVAAGCAAVAGDDDVCAAVAATQLARYASSSIVRA